ncbi:MAG: hypothetical protein WCA37_16615 [Terracidiphilus sp.]
MDQTIQLAFRIAIVWSAGFVVAVGVRALLPDRAGVTFAASQGSLFLPYSRIGFWTCMLAALTVTGLVVFRAMMADMTGGMR